MQIIDQDNNEPRIKRPVVSDLDGTREGGLAFCIALILGMIVAAVVYPGALTSFVVWFVLILMAVSVAAGTKRFFARSKS